MIHKANTSIKYDPSNKEHRGIYHVTLFTILVGVFLSAGLLGVLLYLYKQAEDSHSDGEEHTDKINKIDIGGLTSIVLIGLIYWFISTKVIPHWTNICVSYEVAELWPHLAFRYGLGLGLILPLIKTVTHDRYNNNIEQFFPLLIISLILGSYVFMFIQYGLSKYGKCNYIIPHTERIRKT